MASTIGIKVANGEFYPIMEENSPVKKRLILTTAHDSQKSIQVDLYNSYGKTMADALYVGSLVVDNLQPRPRGEPNIEMTLSSDSSGRIMASAVDLDSSLDGAPQHLGVSLTDVAEDDRANDEIPDFELESRGLYDRDEASFALRKKKPSRRLLLIIIGALLLALGGFACFFFFSNRGAAIRGGFRGSAPAAMTAVPDPAAETAQPQASAPEQAFSDPAAGTAQSQASAPDQTQEQALPDPAEPLVSAALPPPDANAAGTVPPVRIRPSAPVASYKVPRTIPRGGAPYTIRRGDTLWDISEAFYHNPWLYRRIARFNSIRNPDRIIPGSAIKIPPRN
jgi:nucleoid-associated protein YgaU